MQKSEIVKFRDRFQNAKNIISIQTDFMKMKKMKITLKKQRFQNFTIKEFSKLKHIEMKIAVTRNEIIDLTIEHAIQRAFTRDRNRDRDRPKNRGRNDRTDRTAHAD